MVVQGPALLGQLPAEMQNSIQAYLCGPDALRFAPNGTMAAGAVVVDDLSKYWTPPPLLREEEARSVDVSF